MMGAMSERSAERLDAYEENYDGPMSVVALALVTLFLVRVTDTAQGDAYRFLVLLGLVLWLLLVVDLVIRLVLAPSKWRFVVAQPLYIASVFFPPMRFFMIGRVVRFLNKQARDRMRDRITAYVLVITTEVIAVSAILVTAVERDAAGATIKTLGDGLWWSIVTIATVGYGDVVPVTRAGRLIGVGVIVVALVLLSVITANISSRFVAAQAQHDAEGTDNDGVAVRLGRIEQLLKSASTDAQVAVETPDPPTAPTRGNQAP